MIRTIRANLYTLKLLKIKAIKAHLQVRLYLFQETLALANSDYLTHIDQIGILDVRVEN